MMLLHIVFPCLVAVKSSFYGAGTGRIILDDVTCTGEEANLMDCSRRNENPLFETDCDHNEDAGVKCNGSCPFIQLFTGCIHYIFMLLQLSALMGQFV